MHSVSEAFSVILTHRLSLPIETISLEEACGRVLREPLLADRDMPPFNRVAMDGIAIRYQYFSEGQRQFSVLGMQRAGQPAQVLTDEWACLEVMTGAVLPIGADAVIGYEDVHLSDGVAEIRVDDVKYGQHVHWQGVDHLATDRLVEPGTRIGPAEIAVAASVGKTRIQVSTLPRIALISTGDELVDSRETPLPHQIRRSNTYLLQAILQSAGARTTLVHVPDERDSMETVLRGLLADFDALVLSGGVSAGKADFVPEVMEQLGVRQQFHRVAQRPGKPLWFGIGVDGQVVFGLPGNPVSTFLCAYRYVLPWLNHSLGLPVVQPPVARLARSVTVAPRLTYFLPVTLSISGDGIWWAEPLPGSGSADYANLVHGNGFLELPPDRHAFNKGSMFPVWCYNYP